MRLALIVVGAAAFYVVLGVIITIATAPVAYYAGELQDWLAGELGETWAVLIASVLGIAAAIAVAVTVIYIPLALIRRFGRDR